MLLVLIGTNIYGQDFKLSDPLPQDPNVITGVLPNGMTYYVRHNAEPKNRAYLWLVVNAGSVCEDTNQLGLAHFMEHMQFNGTKHFPKDRLIKFLESTGMKFGADLNAYTSFDETVYMLEVPLDKPAYLDTALLIMYDWSHLASLETEEIEKERGVIHEEWRLGKGAQDRLMRQTLPVIFWGSKYAEREPIGKPEVFDHFAPDVLRQFHKDWYRPDLEAIIVVGDFDAQKVANEIKKMFSDFQGPEKERPRVYPELPQHKDVKVKVATDKEARYPLVEFVYKHPMKQIKTYGDYRDMLVTNLFEQILNQRLRENMMKPSSPYAFAAGGYSHLIDKTDALFIYSVAKSKKIADDVKFLLEETKRIKEYGFTQDELDRAKKSILKDYEKAYKEKDKTKSEDYLQEYHKNFSVEKAAFPGIDLEYKLANKFVPEISLDEVNNKAKSLITDENMVIIVTAPEKDDVPVPSEQDILNMVKEVKETKLAANETSKTVTSLIDKEPKAGKVEKEETNKELGTVTWTLSNGIKVVLKQTDFKNDEILLSAYSKGGYSLYKPKDLTEARVAAEFINNSGLGKLSPVDLDKYLSDKNASVSPYISKDYEGFDGKSSVDDFETMMQMVYLYFTQPRYDEESFDAYKERMVAMLENKASDPQSVWIDTLTSVLSSRSIYGKPLSADDYKNVDYKKIYKIYKKRFSDPASFTFVLVGNLDPAKVKPVIEKYLGSLKAKDRHENYVYRGAVLPVGKVERKSVYKGTEDKSMTIMMYTGNFENNLKESLLLKGVSEILTDHLLKSIREEQALTYSISAFPRFQLEPKSRYGVMIFYSSSPDTAFYIVDEVNRISNDIKKEITDKEYKATIAKLKKEHEVKMRENDYWLEQIERIEKGLSDGSSLLKYNDVVSTIKKEDLKKAAAKYLNEKSYIAVVLKPEKKK